MTFYLSGAVAYCIFLIYRMFQDRECSKTDPASWTIIAIASLFWIIVIPISIMELQTKSKAKTTAKQTNTVREIESEAETTTSPISDY